MANEEIILTAPVAQPALGRFRPGSLHLSVKPVPLIIATLIRNDNDRGELFEYPATGTSLDTPAKVLAAIEAFNTANLSVRSLWRRLLDKLLLDFPNRFPGGGTVS